MMSPEWRNQRLPSCNSLWKCYYAVTRKAACLSRFGLVLKAGGLLESHWSSICSGKPKKPKSEVSVRWMLLRQRK